MKKNLKWFDEHFEEALLVILLVVIACVSLLQVVVRKLPFVPSLRWAEEFCRFAWIWSVFLSLPYTVKKGNMLRVTIVLDLLPQKVRKSVNIAIDFIVAAVMAFLCRYSVPVIQKVQASAETSPAIGWPMWIIYIIVFAGFFLGTLRGIQMAVFHIAHFSEKELTAKEKAEADPAASIVSDTGKERR